ncbi:hypothetical protein ACFQUU_27405 [Herbaspirillum sp. GCM10030257]
MALAALIPVAAQVLGGLMGGGGGTQQTQEKDPNTPDPHAIGN